jgi:hypothetical protein
MNKENIEINKMNENLNKMDEKFEIDFSKESIKVYENKEENSLDENKILILDTGAIINGVSLYKLGSTFYTTPGFTKNINI